MAGRKASREGLEDAILDLTISLLDHALKNDVYESILISSALTLGARVSAEHGAALNEGNLVPETRGAESCDRPNHAATNRDYIKLTTVHGCIWKSSKTMLPLSYLLCRVYIPFRD